MAQESESKRIWCPYTDAILSPELTSIEHIIPLSLGGLNGFTISVDRRLNSWLGSEIDGRLANDFLTLFRRRDHGARGHSGRSPFPVSKSAHLEESGRPVQVSFPSSGLELWDPRQRQAIDLDAHSETRFSVTIKLDLDVRLRFAAKVALAAGYLLYGDFFRYHVRHTDLRLLMQDGVATDKPFDQQVTLRMYDQFSEVSEEDRINNTIIRGIHEAVDGSSVVFGHGPSNLVVSVGILRKYIASLNVEAEIEVLDLPDEYNWGQVVFLQNGQVQHGTLRKAVLLLSEKLGIADLPPELIPGRDTADA